MRLLVVEVNDKGASGEYETLEAFSARLHPNGSAAEPRAIDEAVLAVINIAHVGMVVPFRKGWVFITQDTL